MANNLLLSLDAIALEKYFDLHVYTCMYCGLVQIPSLISREDLFPNNYTYYSSYSSSWLEHSRDYANRMIESLSLSDKDLVIEVASNDGYLLQFFRTVGIPVLGIEPAAEVARVAKDNLNVPTLNNFFGEELALKISKQYPKPKLMIANNVLAHVPDLHDFIAGFEILIAEDGIITFEFPHLLNLILSSQFDTIYHEHYSYLSLSSLLPIFAAHNLRVFDVENLNTHGGSLRVFVCKTASSIDEKQSVKTCLDIESIHDPRQDRISHNLQKESEKIKFDLLRELKFLAESGEIVAAYGAAAKGNTLLNFAGIDSELVRFVVDQNPFKQGKFLPGSHIPVVDEKYLQAHRPDVLLVLPWNLANEIVDQLHYLRKEGVRFLKAIPAVEYF